MTRENFQCNRCGLCCRSVVPSFWAFYPEDYRSVPDVFNEAVAVLGASPDDADDHAVTKAIGQINKVQQQTGCDKMEMEEDVAICTLQRDHGVKPSGCVVYPLYEMFCLREQEEAE